MVGLLNSQIGLFPIPIFNANFIVPRHTLSRLFPVLYRTSNSEWSYKYSFLYLSSYSAIYFMHINSTPEIFSQEIRKVGEFRRKLEIGNNLWINSK